MVGVKERRGEGRRYKERMEGKGLRGGRGERGRKSFSVAHVEDKRH